MVDRRRRQQRRRTILRGAGAIEIDSTTTAVLFKRRWRRLGRVLVCVLVFISAAVAS